MGDPFDLKRFVKAQDHKYAQALTELRNGRKVGHWMWFIFPQIEGLGSSPTAQLYAIHSLEEARAYLLDPVLGPRLEACTEAVNSVVDRSAYEIFGDPDVLKFKSSMTLFLEAMPEKRIFLRALEKYYDAERDPLTLQKLGSA